MDKLTPEQIENWRHSLLQILGPYALIMPVEQIEALRNRMQGSLIFEEGDSDDCDKCGQEFPMSELQMVACEGVFCQNCADTLMAGPFGDGRYCTHHDDDPAHTNDCYGPPSDEMYQIASVI